MVEGTPGVLHASLDFRGSASFAWSPTKAEEDAVRELVRHEDALFGPLNASEVALEWSERTRFFFVPNRRAQGEVERFAFVGGRALMLACANTTGHWTVCYLDAEMHAAGFAPSNAYTAVAILDITDDGIAEVVFNESDGPTWAQGILQTSRETSGWTRVGASPGGSTL